MISGVGSGWLGERPALLLMGGPLLPGIGESYMFP